MPRGKKVSPSKSQAIREVLEKDPKASAKEVVETLAQQGIPVKPGLVYMIKGRLKQVKAHRRRKAKRAARVAGAANSNRRSEAVALIRKVKELAREAGGFASLEELIAVLAE